MANKKSLNRMEVKTAVNKRHAYFKSQFTTRAEPDGKLYIEGYFAVFAQETELWPGWFEQIAPGAFDNSLTGNDIRCLFNHETGFVLGRAGAGTLALRADRYGLWGSVEVNQADRQAMDVYARVQRGDISGCSFGFDPISESTEQRADGFHTTVTEADTIEVSVCTFPAYPQTEVQARKRDFEQTTARAFAARKTDIKKRLEAITHVETA